MTWHQEPLDSEGEAGLSLIEILIVAAISGLVIALVGTAFFQFNKLTRLQYDVLTLDHQLHNAGALLGHDVSAAAGGVVAGDAMTLTVPVHTFGQPSDPITKTITYSVAGDTLMRSDESGSVVVARYLEDVDFGVSGQVGAMVNLTLTVALREESRTATLAIHRRPAD